MENGNREASRRRRKRRVGKRQRHGADEHGVACWVCAINVCVRKLLQCHRHPLQCGFRRRLLPAPRRRLRHQPRRGRREGHHNGHGHVCWVDVAHNELRTDGTRRRVSRPIGVWGADRVRGGCALHTAGTWAHARWRRDGVDATQACCRCCCLARCCQRRSLGPGHFGAKCGGSNGGQIYCWQYFKATTLPIHLRRCRRRRRRRRLLHGSVTVYKTGIPISPWWLLEELVMATA